MKTESLSELKLPTSETPGQISQTKLRLFSQQISGKETKGHYYNFPLNLGLIKDTFS